MKDLNTLAFEAGVMPITFSENIEDVKRAVTAIEKTAIPAIEILQRGENAEDCLREALKIKKNAYIGAGTICTLEHCKKVVDMGVDFIVSPGFDVKMIEWCVANNVFIIPGASTVSEVMQSSALGLKTLKFFPFNELGGITYMESIAGVFPDIKFVITGALDHHDLHYLKSDKVAAIGGVWMFCDEIDHTVFSEEKIISRTNVSLQLAKIYRNGLE